MGSFIEGLKDYFLAGRLIWRLRLWPWLLVPGLVGLVYFPGLLWLAVQYLQSSVAYLEVNWIPGWLNYTVVVWVIAISLCIGCAYIGFSLYRNVIMVVYGPVLGIVSEKAEAGIRSQTVPPDQQGSIGRGMVRGTLMSVTSLSLSVVMLICCWALLLIPVIGGILLAISLPLGQMFLAGQGFLDPTLERKGYGIRESLVFCWRNSMRTVGCGAGFTLLSLVPVVGWFLAPGFGIVAGTKSTLDLLRKSRSG